MFSFKFGFYNQSIHWSRDIWSLYRNPLKSIFFVGYPLDFIDSIGFYWISMIHRWSIHVLVEWGDVIGDQNSLKNPKKVKKTQKNPKNPVLGGGVKIGTFRTHAILAKKSKKTLPNSPPSQKNSIFFECPRCHFYAVPVLVVGGVQSGGEKKILFFPAILGVSKNGGTILGVDIIHFGGGEGGQKDPFLRVFLWIVVDHVNISSTGQYSLNRYSIGAATLERPLLSSPDCRCLIESNLTRFTDIPTISSQNPLVTCPTSDRGRKPLAKNKWRIKCLSFYPCFP